MLDKKYQKAVENYYKSLDEITNSDENWRDFLRVMSNCFGLPRVAQLAIWQRDSSTMAAMSNTSWQKFNFAVNENKALFVPSGNTVKAYYIIDDVIQKENSKPILIWYSDNKDYPEIIQAITKNFNLSKSKDNNDILSIIHLYAESIEFSNKQFSEIFQNSLKDIILLRLGFDTSYTYGYKYKFNKINREDKIYLIDKLSDASKSFINIVKSISIKNFKYVNYTFENHDSINYNGIDINVKEENSNDGLRRNNESGGLQRNIISSNASGGRGSIRRTKRILDSPIEQNQQRKTEEQVHVLEMGLSQGKQTGDNNRFDAPGAGTRKQANGSSYGNSGKDVRRSDESEKRDNGTRRYGRITGNRLVEICSGTRERYYESRGNLPGDNNLQLNLFNTKSNKTVGLDKNDPAVFIYENVEKELLSGTGFTDGKFRVYEFFINNSDRKDRIKFISREYGEGSHSFDFTDGSSGWANHNSKGLSITDSQNETIHLRWSNVIEIIDILINSDTYLSSEEREKYPQYLEQKQEKQLRSDFISRVEDIIHDAKKLPEDIINLKSSVLSDKSDFILKNNQNSINEKIYKLLSACSDSNLNIKNDSVSLLNEFRRFAPEYFKRSVVDEYFKLQEKHPNNIVFMKIGAFFEVMGDNAKQVSEELDLVLTSRTHNNKRIPLCGIPEKRLDEYTNRLINNGSTVIIATLDEDNTVTKSYNIIPAEKTVAISDNLEIQSSDEILLEAEQKDNKSKTFLTLNDFIIEKPSKTRLNTNTHRNYKAILDIVPILLNERISYIHLTAGDGFMPLIIEKIGNNRISVSHYYIQNGDKVSDPDMEFVFDTKNEELRPRSYQQDNLGLYETVEKDNQTIDMIAEARLSNFTNNWFQNIKAQGYIIDNILFEYKDEEMFLHFNESGILYKIDSDFAEQFCQENDVILAENYNEQSIHTDISKNNELPIININGSDGSPTLIDKPVVYCIFSENTSLKGDTTYSFDEFNSAMKTLDEAAYQVKKSHNDDQIYDVYDKVKYSVILPSGKKITVRQDIGDGYGSVIDFLSNYDIYKDFARELADYSNDNKQDRFFINPDNMSVTWLYNNPDSGSGNQYVENNVTFEQIKKAAKLHSNPDEFFEELEIHANQSLGDIGTPNFAELDEIYHSCLHNQEGLTINSMTALIEASGVQPSNKVNYQITDNEIGVGTKSQRYAANVNAIRTLKKIESENRLATPDEQEILAKYVGWGGLADVFDDRHTKYNELHSLLNEQEYVAARSSTLTAFYTPPIVIRSIYSALKNMGFSKGNILEPSCGIGNFFGLLPNELSDDVNLTGVELDSISGRIAKKLYPNANIQIKGFENTDFENDSFDVIIGNVPFGQFTVTDKEYDKNHFLIHDYFFAKALDKVRSGGIIAFITSKGTLDKDNPSVRKYIAKRAELLGAIRLPDNTFKRLAGTEVTSDIIFLQKREIPLDIEPEWVHLGLNENSITINDYFIEHPEMVLGDMQMISTAYGQDSTCKDNGKELSLQLSQAINRISGNITEVNSQIISKDKISKDISDNIPAIDGVKDQAYIIIDNRLYQRNGSVMQRQNPSKKNIEKYKALINVKNACYELINIQVNGADDATVEEYQERLNNAYDYFVSEFCRINDKSVKKLFFSDPAYSLLCSLEKFDSNGNFKQKSDMFYKRTIRTNKIITSAKTSDDALMASLSVKGAINMPYMMQLTGFSQEKIENDLTNIIFRKPNMNITDPIKWVTADEYLSGNVRDKLDLAKMFYNIHNDENWIKTNISALENIQPKRIKAAEIKLRLGATWIPEEIINDFMYHLLKTSSYNRYYVKASYSDLLGRWNIDNKGYEAWSVQAKSTYGTTRVNAYQLLEDALNLKDTVVRDPVENDDGKIKYIVNEKETRIAQGKQKLIKKEFENWVWKDSSRRKQLEDIYNKKFNSCVQRKYNGSHLNFDGMNCNITLRQHQKDAVARILYGGNTLLAHTVGAGKTFEMCAAAMEAKRIGLCHKSMIVVPNNIVGQMSSEFMTLYPNANILTATEKDFSKENRKKFCSRIATGDYDAVIIGHSQFEKIPLSKEFETEMLQKQLDNVVEGINKFKGNTDRLTVKQLEKSRKSIEERLKKLNDIERDDVVTFEQLGVDKLFVDEAHNYKNLFLYTKMSNVAGISTSEAKKSTDLFNKVRWLDSQTNGKGTVFATGTPVSNSMVELYTMQRYLQYNRLNELGLIHFDSWASTFGETTTELELKPEGTGFRLKKRFAKFYNIPELMTIFREVADIQTKEMLNLPLPKVNFINKVCQPSEIQKNMVKSLAARADKIRDGSVSSDVDNMLLITSEGRKLALDQRIIEESLPDNPDSKVNQCANNVFRIWKDNSKEKLTQLVFCDLSTPNNKSFNVYDDLKSKLIDKGIPDKEIAFIHDANTNAKKEELNSKVRSGNVRVLLGSTQKCGTGTNVQDKLIAIHDLDCPWRPSDLEQRLGRIERQGNENNEVFCYRYVTEGTFDAYMYQLVEKKQHFINQIWRGDTSIREIEDLDESSLNYAKLKALAVGNPLIQEKMELEIQIRDLLMQKQNHNTQIYDLQDRISFEYPKSISCAKAHIKSLTNELSLIQKHIDDSFIFVNNKQIREPKDIGKVINAYSVQMHNNHDNKILIGTYKGLDIVLKHNEFGNKIIAEIGDNIDITMGIDETTNGKKILSSLDDFESLLNESKLNLTSISTDLENAKEAVKQEFPLQSELDIKQSRLEELDNIFEREQHSPHKQINKSEYIIE